MNTLLMYLKLALRNILKNRRRSFITLFSLGAGFTAIALFTGYTNYVYRGLALNAIAGEMLGHLTIAKQGHAQGLQTDPERYSFSGEELQSLTRLLQQDPQVDFVSPRLSVQGLLSNGNASVIFIGEGLVAADINRVRQALAVEAGQSVPLLALAHDSDAILSTDLADMMRLGQGDDAVLFASTLGGMANAVDITVTGILNTGSQATNDKTVLIPFQHAQAMLETEGATRVLVMLKNASQLESSRQRISTLLQQAGFKVEIQTWIERSASYQPIRELFGMIFLFIFCIVLTISITSVVNTMGMVVMERTREIGTLRALGMHRSQLVALFSAEGLMLAVLGGIAGLVTTVLVALVVNASGMSYVPPNFSERVLLQVELDPLRLLLIFTVLLPLGAMAALVPAWRASRTNIVDALGHV